jgi:DNA-binding NarL/FixJ family response regulator
MTTPHSEAALDSAADSAAAKPCVLVMDDDPLFRSLLVSMLKHDYVVTAAADGAEGFYKALECPPRIAVIDIKMPVWDGIRTLKAFREHEALKDVGLVVLTSDTSQETVFASIAAGADDYDIKSSLSRAEFLRKLAKVGENRKTRTASRLLASAVRQESRSDETPYEPAHSAVNDSAAANERLQDVIDAWE